MGRDLMPLGSAAGNVLAVPENTRYVIKVKMLHLYVRHKA